MNIVRVPMNPFTKWLLAIVVTASGHTANGQTAADWTTQLDDTPALSGVGISAREFSAKKSTQSSLPNRLFIKQPTSQSQGLIQNQILRITPPKVRMIPAPSIADQRTLSPIPVANRRPIVAQDFLNDLPPPEPLAVDDPASPNEDFYGVLTPSQEPQDNKSTPVQELVPSSPNDKSIVPDRAPLQPEIVQPETVQPVDLGEELLPKRSENDLLLDEREKSASPYPKPSFETPSERVVPIPIQPAPEDFQGFEPKTSDDLALPEPRRTFPLPKIERIAPPPSINRPSNQSQSGTPSTEEWTEPSQLNHSYSNHVAGYPMIQQNPENWRERLNDKRWQLNLKHQLPVSPIEGPLMTTKSFPVPYQEMDFTPIPFQAKPLDPQLELQTYTGKLAVETQRPWVEWWRPFYTGGMYEPGVPVFSDVNLLQPSFLVYGDYRTAVGVHRDNGQHIRNWAHRLNLDMDLRLTGTERFHLFTGPLDHNERFTRLDFSNNPIEFEEELDFQADTAFFEGDLGAITGSLLGDDAPFDLPFTCGLVPLLYQNGIWMEDAIAGFAFGTPWKHNRALNISNFDATFFAGFNQVTSPAFQNDNNAAGVYGTAWFLEAYSGYIEADYAYLDDFDNEGRSYHNAAIAYTRRYFGRISNSVRLIGNAGQTGPANTRSADGALLLFENSLISSKPSNVVPYWNFFVGSGRPQSVARAANAGGILRNTGINFESDFLTGYPTLNATGANAYGGAIGINVLSADFRQQWIGEFAALDTYGDPLLKAVAGPQYALGTRYQRAINNRSIWRIDFINGWLDRASDIYGMRTEFRWKF